MNLSLKGALMNRWEYLGGPWKSLHVYQFEGKKN